MAEQSGVLADRPIGSADGGSASLLRVAGYGAIGAIATLVVAGVALAVFFSDTEGLAIFGPINDLATALTLVLVVPAVIATAQLARAGSWFTALAVVTVIGMLVAAAGLVLLVIGVVDLQGSFVIGGIGMLPFLAWIGAVAYLGLSDRLLSGRLMGWWAVALLATIALSIAATPFISMAALSFTLAPVLLIVLVGFLASLGRGLLAASQR